MTTSVVESPVPSLEGDGINYNFVAVMYGAAIIILVLLVFLDKFMAVPQVEGFWIIFSPFLPCFLWSLVARRRWKQEMISKSKAE